MKKKITVVVCDVCGADIPDGTGASVKTSFNDRRKGRIVADYCDAHANELPGQRQKAHGRKSAAELAAA